MATTAFSLLLLLAGAVCCSAQSSTDMGALPAIDDGTSDPIPISTGFPFGNTVQSTVYVVTNGFLAFGEPRTDCCPVPLEFTFVSYVVAPFWADADIRLGGNVTYTVQSQANPDSNRSLEEFSRIVQFQGGVTDFNGTWMLVANWEEVPQFSGFPNVTNTFSAAVITDGVQSFAIFFYQCGDLNWGDNAIVGFKANGSVFQRHSLSQGNATAIACNTPTLLYKLTPSEENYRVSERIPIEVGFPFGDAVHHEAYVGNNGFITFGSNEFTGCCPNGIFSEGSEPNYVVAPFWADTDFGYGSDPDFQVYTNEDNSSASLGLLDNVNNFIRATEGGNFEGRWMLLVTWNRIFLSDDGTPLENLFVGVMITDGSSQSYALFQLSCGLINWGDSAVIGFKAEGFHFENHPFSGSNATDVGCRGSEFGILTYSLAPINVVDPNEGFVRISFVRPLNSFFESDSEVQICLNVNGTMVDEFDYSFNLFLDPISSEIYGNDVHSREIRFEITDNSTQCYSVELDADDTILEHPYMEGFLAGLGSTSLRVRLGTSFSENVAVYYSIDDEIVHLDFTRPAYTASEGDGVQHVCVRLTVPDNTPIERPVTFRIHARNGNAIGGEDFSVRALRPQIGYFNIGARNGDRWCLPVPITDDSIAEEEEVFSVNLFVSDVQVVALQTSVEVTITDNDEDVPLEVYFAGDTPRIVGNSITLQVRTNQPASVICRLNSTTQMECPPRIPITITGVTPGRYTVRAIATARSASQEVARTEGYIVNVPQNRLSCSAHFINRGLSVDGNTATVEFGGAGDNDGFVCRLDSQAQQACTSPFDLGQLSSGTHRLRITPRCSGSSTFAHRFDI